MKENTKMTETTATVEVQGTINNIIDKFASGLVGATTPINLDINIAVGVKGSIGDVQIAVTSENYGTVTNGAYRGEAAKAETAAKAEAEAQSFVKESEAFKQELKAHWADPNNDVVRKTIEALIELEIITNLWYELDHRHALIDGNEYEGELGAILRNVALISEERARDLDNVLSDAISCDLIIRARKSDKTSYKVIAEPRGHFTKCGDDETMAQFINRITKE